MPTDKLAEIIQEAHELRNQELQRLATSLFARIRAFRKDLTTRLLPRLNRLLRSYVSWNPRAHPFH